MSFLREFFIEFDADSTNLQKEAVKVDKITEKLTAKFKETDSITKDITKSFSEAGVSLAGFAGTALSVASILYNLKDAINYTTSLDYASQALQINAEELDAWGYIVQETGGNLQSFENSLKSLSRNLGTSSKGALQLLIPLSDALHAMGQTRALRYGEMLGLDDQTILTLQKGSKELKQLINEQKQLGIVTKKEIEIVHEYNTAWRKITHSFREASIEAASGLLPVFNEISDVFVSAALSLQKHSDFIIGGLIGIGAAAAIMAAPILVTTGIIFSLGAAFALVYEDLMAYKNGNDSLTGLLLERWPKVKFVVEEATWAVKEFIKLVSHYKDPTDLLPSGSIFSNPFSSNVDKPQHVENMKIIKQAIDLPLNVPLTSLGSNSILNNQFANKTINVKTGPITINTEATDAEGISTALGRGLFAQMWQANSNFDDGVLA